jgi:hypothetical protein
MKSRTIKLAAAAVIVVAMVIGFNELVSTNGSGSAAFANMIETMKQMPWIHWTVTSVVRGERTIESWFCFDSGVFASKHKDGRLLYNNEKENYEYTYDQQKNVIFFSQVGDDVREHETLPGSSFQFFEIIMAQLNKEASEITREAVLKDSQEVEIITAEMTPDSNVDKEELIRDIKRNVLLSMKVDYKDASKSLVAIFDYPTEGPKNIYDLGASRDVEIVSLLLPSDVQQLIKKLNTLRETTLTRYVAVSVPSNISQLPTSFTERRPNRYFTGKDSLVSSIWRRGGERNHSMGYFSEESDSVPSLESLSVSPQDAAELLVAVKTSIYKANERRIYTYQILNGEPVRNIRKGPVETYGREIFIEQICWPQIVVPRNKPVEWKIESITSQDNELLIVIERRTKSFTGRWLLNPARNHICQKYEHKHSDGTPIQLIEILEYANTQSGQWYPRRIQKTEDRQADGEELQETTCRVIYLKENQQFPEEIFDPGHLPKAND